MGPYLNSNECRDFSSPSVGPGACGRAHTHPEEAERIVRNPINQARLLLASLIITNRTVGSTRRLHRDVCGCLHYEDCPTEAARQQRDAEIRARKVEIEIRGYLDMAQGVGA